MQPSLIEGGDLLTYRIQEGGLDQSPVVMFHGFGGDEDVMWVLQAGLPTGRVVIAPRAPFAADEGGYSWVRQRGPELSKLDEFQEGAARAKRWLDDLTSTRKFSTSNCVFMGFSQGAALAFVLAADPNFRPAMLASLAGFLPEGVERDLEIDVFWAHGRQDDQVPVARARQDVLRLETYGTSVEYCEEDTGHKVSAACMRALKQFLTDRQ